MRRSISGDILIWISDLININILIVVTITQTILITILYFVTYTLIKEDSTGALSLIAMSSSFFLFFWVADPQGSGRKEIITFTAMILISIALRNQSLFILFTGSIIFTISVLTHEAMILFLPVVIAALIIYIDVIEKKIYYNIIFAITAGASLAAFYFALSHPRISDSSVVCQPLIERGAQPEICEGAIEWLEYDLQFGIERVHSFLSAPLFLDLIIGYMVALAPALYLATLSTNRKLAFLMIILSFFPLLPLYLFAIDYGRWISFHLFSIFFLFSIAISSKKIILKRKIGFNTIIAACLISAFFSHNHTMGIYWGGIARRLASDILKLTS